MPNNRKSQKIAGEQARECHGEFVPGAGTTQPRDDLCDQLAGDKEVGGRVVEED